MFTYLGLALLFLILLLLLRIVRSAERADEPEPTSRIGSPANLLSMSLNSGGPAARIVVNGRTYSSPDEMPPEARDQYEFAMRAAIAATTPGGIGDLLKLAGGNHLPSANSDLGAPADPTTRLKQLEEMKNEGLITTDEYETKRAEILESL